MRHETISIDLLDGHARNYRQHPPEQIERLKASLLRFQQVRSIVVAPEIDGRFTILSGHGVVAAARECDLGEIICDIVPDNWDQATRDAYLLADNLHGLGAIDDEELLAELLQEQQDAGYTLEALGTSDAALQEMLQELGDTYLEASEKESGAAGRATKEYDESIEDDLETEMCEQCGKLCVKSGRKRDA